MPEINQPEYIEFDVATVNNMGNTIKVRNISIYKDEYDPPNDDKIKERLASELGYEGLGEYIVYAHDPALNVGDQVPAEVELLHTVSIAVFSSSAFNSTIEPGSVWIPVATVGQKTTLIDGTKISLSKESLESNLESWKGGYINVNHEDNGEIDGMKIEGAKFENDMLYHKVNTELAEFIQGAASSGRSIEISDMKLIDGVVMSYSGMGLSVLFPPLKPSCTTDMGCSSTGSPAIKTVFTKLADRLKSHSSMNEDSGTEPHLETSMNEDIDKLKFAKMEADKSRDEALKEAETLKFSLAEKDSVLIEKDKLLTDKDAILMEQTDKLKFYADAEAVAAEKRTNDQWETLKSSIPVGKFHKPEDEAALKQEFIDDPAGFAVKMLSFSKEDPKGESGAEFVAGDPSSDVEIKKGISAMGIPSITFEGGR